MEIKSTLTNRSGQVLNVIYKDIDNESEINNKIIKSVHAYCFYNDKLVIVYSEDKKYWTPPGGSVEKDENICDTVIREVKEETNMKVITQCFIGYQDIFEPNGLMSQTRSVCIVEPYGQFINDPDGDITEIKFINPKDYKDYFNWGEIGDHLMARALELKVRLESLKI